MDVGNPSNFPRILELYGQRHEAIVNEITGYAYSDLGIHDALVSKNEDVNGIFLATAHPAKFYTVINKIIDAEITFPHSLKSILNKEKKSFPLSSDYKALREFLLNLHGIL